jgi:hypothetical protein
LPAAAMVTAVGSVSRASRGERCWLNRLACRGEKGCVRAKASKSRHGMTWARGTAATCARGAGVRRRRRWPVGAGRFRAARERAARGNRGLGANVGGRPGTSGRRGAPAVVPGQPVVWPGAATSTTSHVGANAWHLHPVEIGLALFNCILLQIFQ